MIKQIDDDLYNVICGWWNKREWPVLPKGMISELGYVAFVNEKPIIAAWVYKDQSSWFGQMDWLISDPDSSPKEREEGFSLLEEHIIKTAKEMGIIYILTGTNNENLINKYKNKGWVERDNNVTYLSKSLY